jgi:predicted acyl esterase
MTFASRFMGQALKLPPPSARDVDVERDLCVPMPDGAVLLADRYVPRGADRPPLLLVRSPYGRRRHRLRLQVSSGAHPRYARKTGTGEPLATATTLARADQQVFHDPGHPSAIILPVAPG